MDLLVFSKLDELITTGNYEEAIFQSKKLPPESFYLIAYKHLGKLFKGKKNQSPFWDAMFTSEAAHLFQSEFIHGRIGLFWKSNWTLSQIEAFAKHHPKVFIQSIRITEKYLEYGFLEMMFRINVSDTYISQHLQKMTELRDSRSEVKQRLALDANILNEMSLESVLGEMVMWWEMNRKPGLRTNEPFLLTQIVIQKYFDLKTDKHGIDHDSCFLKFADVLSNYFNTSGLKLQPLLNSAIQLEQFTNQELANYSYELNNEFNRNKQYQIDHKAKDKFLEDGEKLQIFEAYYHNLGQETVLHLIEKGEIELHGKNLFEWNKIVVELSSKLILLYIGQFEELNEVDYFIPTYLSTIHFHAVERFRHSMDSLLASSQTVPQALYSMTQINESVGFPIQLNSKAELQQKVENTYINVENTILIEQTLARCTTPATSIDLLRHNMIDIGNGQILNLMHLTAEDNPMLKGYYNILEYAAQKENQNSDNNFERAIKNNFINTGFTNSLQGTIYGPKNPQKLPGDLDGDVDVIVVEDDHVLILEVKRVDLRNDGQGIWNEKEKVLWASLQLHKAQLAIKNKDEALMKILPEKRKTITSLIITPWFEYDHEFIGSFMKVSWFEIKYALEHMKGEWQNAPNKLQALINLILEDKVWVHIRKGYEQYLQMMEEARKGDPNKPNHFNNTP